MLCTINDYSSQMRYAIARSEGTCTPLIYFTATKITDWGAGFDSLLVKV